MWLPLKVRHLVLINQTPLPTSFFPSSSPPPPSLSSTRFPPALLPPPSSTLFPPHPRYVLPIFGEKPVCSWDNLKLKTNSQLPSEAKGISWALFGKKGGKKTHFWLLIVEECLSKLRSYQAQSVAREGGRCMHSAEVGEGFFFVADSKWRNKSFTFCVDAALTALPHLLGLLLAQAGFQLRQSNYRNSCRSVCVTNVNCVLTLMVWKYFSAGRYPLKPPVGSCLELWSIWCSLSNLSVKRAEYNTKNVL